MLKLFETVKVLHIEPTDVCQAACPLCYREIDVTFNKNIHNSLTVSDIQQLLPKKIISNLDKMFMCGVYGDPAASKETIAIYDYFRLVNDKITLGMNTNGGLQSTDWWKNLGKRLNRPKDYAVFSIDGLEDTNHIYRKNVVWDKVISNAEAFIQAGGNAHWDMLVYEHNEHQVDECERLAQAMGFKWFRAKVSKRPHNITWLKPPKNWPNPIVESSDIKCFALEENSVYISATGQIYPCCWLTNTEWTIDKFDQVQSNWASPVNCNPICKTTCGKKDNLTSFSAQWQREAELNV